MKCYPYVTERIHPIFTCQFLFPSVRLLIWSSLGNRTQWHAFNHQPHSVYSATCYICIICLIISRFPWTQMFACGIWNNLFLHDLPQMITMFHVLTEIVYKWLLWPIKLHSWPYYRCHKQSWIIVIICISSWKIVNICEKTNCFNYYRWSSVNNHV